jgi:hypothetical protein
MKFQIYRSCAAWLGRWVRRLPNFLPSVPIVAMSIWATGWVHPDSVMMALSATMLALLIGCGVSDLMALYYRAKLSSPNHGDQPRPRT